MLINIIIHNAEQALLTRLEHSDTSWGALYVQCSRQNIKPAEEAIAVATHSMLEGRKASLYVFQNGDLVITWQGAQKAMVEALRKQLYRQLHLSPNEVIDRYYDSKAHGEELRLLCKKQLAHVATPSGQGFFATSDKLPAPSDSQMANFRILAKERIARKKLEILIVEDQIFSSKLLAGLLNRIAKTYVAPNAERAMELYITHAPDIVFLDIEMPGISGHELGAALNPLDADAYIIMVTANNHLDDVARARANGAKGFVVKPYSKLKILEGVEKYIYERKLKP